VAGFERHFVLLYVENPPASAEFYSRLLGHAPVETAPTFAMLPLRDSVMLGLWSRATVCRATIKMRAAAGCRAINISAQASIDPLAARNTLPEPAARVRRRITPRDLRWRSAGYAAER
jgi:catechol 2,3-dioxygenase-like lactoylglutathione lyase family enzyme